MDETLRQSTGSKKTGQKGVNFVKKKKKLNPALHSFCFDPNN